MIEYAEVDYTNLTENEEATEEAYDTEELVPINADQYALVEYDLGLAAGLEKLVKNTMITGGIGGAIGAALGGIATKNQPMSAGKMIKILGFSLFGAAGGLGVGAIYDIYQLFYGAAKTVDDITDMPKKWGRKLINIPRQGVRTIARSAQWAGRKTVKGIGSAARTGMSLAGRVGGGVVKGLGYINKLRRFGFDEYDEQYSIDEQYALPAVAIAIGRALGPPLAMAALGALAMFLSNLSSMAMSKAMAVNKEGRYD